MNTNEFSSQLFQTLSLVRHSSILLDEGYRISYTDTDARPTILVEKTFTDPPLFRQRPSIFEVHFSRIRERLVYILYESRNPIHQHDRKRMLVDDTMIWDEGPESFCQMVAEYYLSK